MSDLEKLPLEVRHKIYDDMDGKALLDLSSTSSVLRAEVLAYVNDILIRGKLIFLTPKQHGWDANGTHAYKNQPLNVLRDWIKGHIGRKPS